MTVCPNLVQASHIGKKAMNYWPFMRWIHIWFLLYSASDLESIMPEYDAHGWSYVIFCKVSTHFTQILQSYFTDTMMVPVPVYQSWCAWIDTLRPRQDGQHIADDICKCIFLNENVLIPIKISLKFIPKVWINHIPTLIQIMAWHRPGDKPLSETLMFRLLTHICVTRPQWVHKSHESIGVYSIIITTH